MSNMFSKISSKSVENENFSSYPSGYVKGKTKYIIVFGTVMSGLGKGIFSSSIGKLLQLKGFDIQPVKFDGYLNQDAGTLNPFRHGEVFVLEDGTESDMDLGTYERILNINLTHNNYLTSGKLFQKILNKEREGEYLGRDVQVIPHVTGEIKYFLRELAIQKKSDVIIVEIGGTAGDLENMYAIEASRQLAREEGLQNVIFVALTYVLEPKFLGEQKSKAAQLGIKTLMSLGIQPHIIGCRANLEVSHNVREKISVASNLSIENIVSLHDVDSIYLIPEMLSETKIMDKIIKNLDLKQPIKKEEETKNIKKWKSITSMIRNVKHKINLGMIGKYTNIRDSYASIIKALEHAGMEENVKINTTWIETTDIESEESIVESVLQNVDGILVAPGFGKRGTEGKIKCVKYARERDIPYLGVCYGMQMAVIEFARNICKLSNANSTEINETCQHKVVDILPEQKKIEGLGGNMRLGAKNVIIKKNTIAYRLYNKTEQIKERFRHRYEVNPVYIDTLEKHGLVFSGKHPNFDIMQIMELPTKRFFLGAQFHPEFISRPGSPSPLYHGFVRAAKKYSMEKSID